MVNFWWFLVIFWSIMFNFSEKVDFAIKNRVFWHFFDLKFHLKLIKFVTFLGSFLGFLGGYPSPSISAPLVVKKCPKLYIYNIGGTPPLWHTTTTTIGLLSTQTSKRLKCTNAKNTGGRTRVLKNTTLWILPDIWNNKINKTQKQHIPVQRGENESTY